MSSPAPKKACVIGYPIKHSRSPVIHNYWLKKYGIEGSYTAEEVHPDALEDFFRRMRDGAFLGCNITLPHKEEALKYVDTIDEVSGVMGAINTAHLGVDGRLHAMNTDAYGFMRNLGEDRGARFKGKTAYMIGAGGAARGVAAALMLMNCKTIYVTNRTSDRLRNFEAALKKMNADLCELSPKFRAVTIEAIGWEDRTESVMKETDLLINTTSQGMDGQPALDLSLKNLKDSATVADIVYTPLETPLLNKAKLRNHATVDGLGMLLHQAAASFYAWFAQAPDVSDELRNLVIADIKAKSAA